MRRTTIKALVLAVLMSVIVACGAPAGRPWRLLIATGGQGGVYYAYGQGIARAARAHLAGADPQVISTAASVQNLRLVGAGNADMAFSLADAAALAFAGERPFIKREPVSAIARLYENFTHLVVARDGGIHSLLDLRGRTVSTGARDSGTQVLATRLLGVAGMTKAQGVRVRDLPLEDSAAALRSGRIDAFFFSGGLPTEAISELAEVLPIRLIDLGDYVGRLRQRYGEFYEERSIPASVYGLPGEVRTIGVPNYLVVNSSMPADRAYALTRLLFGQKDELARAHPEALRLNQRAAISTAPLPLHPGAIRYYRESKLEY